MHKTYSHGHFGLSVTNGRAAKDGQIVNNNYNYSDLVKRTAGIHEYAKNPAANWPKGGYTRKEANRNHKKGVLDVSPQSPEYDQFYLAKDIGLYPRMRNSDLSVLGTRANQKTKANLAAFNQKTGQRLHMMPDWARPASAPSESAETGSTLGLGMFSLTKGNQYAFLNCKGNDSPVPAFARNLPDEKAIAAARQARAERREAKGAALASWDAEVQNRVEKQRLPVTPGGLPRAWL